MGEAKRRKELGLTHREKDFVLPEFNKEEIKQRVRATINKYPIIQYIVYGATIIVLFFGVFSFIRYFK